MADQRTVESIRITDPSAPTTIASVATLSDDFTNPTALAVGAFGMVWNTGDSKWDRMLGSDTTGLLVNVGNASLTVDTELPAAATLADDTDNPTVPGVAAFAMGWDSGDSKWDRIAVSNSRLQVDVITQPGASSPTSPVTDNATASAVAAGSSADLDSADVGGTTQKLWQITLAASVPWKAIVQLVENGAVVATHATIFGEAGDTVVWKPAHENFVSRAFSTNAGQDGFRVHMTNLDTNNAADLYASFEYAAN